MQPVTDFPENVPANLLLGFGGNEVHEEIEGFFDGHLAELVNRALVKAHRQGHRTETLAVTVRTDRGVLELFHRPPHKAINELQNWHHSGPVPLLNLAAELSGKAKDIGHAQGGTALAVQDEVALLFRKLTPRSGPTHLELVAGGLKVGVVNAGKEDIAALGTTKQRPIPQ